MFSISYFHFYIIPTILAIKILKYIINFCFRRNDLKKVNRVINFLLEKTSKVESKLLTPSSMPLEYP